MNTFWSSNLVACYPLPALAFLVGCSEEILSSQYVAPTSEHVWSSVSRWAVMYVGVKCRPVKSKHFTDRKIKGFWLERIGLDELSSPSKIHEVHLLWPLPQIFCGPITLTVHWLQHHHCQLCCTAAPAKMNHWFVTPLRSTSLHLASSFLYSDHHDAAGYHTQHISVRLSTC